MAETITLNESDPHYGDMVTFTVVTDHPDVFVQLVATQGQSGSIVMETWNKPDLAFGLYSPLWTSGAAECVANVMVKRRKKWLTLSSTKFSVAA